ncbi:MAG: SGNH/GDSL hydrolase family protein [Gemmatimonadota bacterium]
MRRMRGAALAWLLAVTACNSVDDVDERVLGPDGQITAGEADFTRYVAIGDSYGAGVVNGAFTCSGQIFAYPTLIARQVGLQVPDTCSPPERLAADFSAFQQPLITDPGVGSPLVLTSPGPPPVITPVPATGTPTNGDLFRPFNNLSVPGADLEEINVAVNQATSLDQNSAFNVVLRGIGTAPDQAAALDATFITFFLGGNDVLRSVLSGGTVEPTPAGTFRTQYRTAIADLLEVTPDIVLANIGDVAAFPFATTIPPVVVDPATQQPVLGPNGQPIPLIGPEGRNLNPQNDLVTLQAASLLAQGIGVPVAVGGTGAPLPDEVVLSGSELNRIRNAAEAYNEAIAEVALEADLVLVDVAAELQAALAAEGILQTTGGPLSIRFLGGGVAPPFFGLDGIHPTPKGYGHIANLFIEAINAEFGASIPLVEVGALPTLIGPSTAQDLTPSPFLAVGWPAGVELDSW